MFVSAPGAWLDARLKALKFRLQVHGLSSASRRKMGVLTGSSIGGQHPALARRDGQRPSRHCVMGARGEALQGSKLALVRCQPRQDGGELLAADPARAAVLVSLVIAK